ncbi:hypothetical protein [Cutibacterium avidum]|uniref:hypothetical protein n=1 Tax=Cutibacterium avidum TaxID=33010 RepID=UPI002FEF4FB8
MRIRTIKPEFWRSDDVSALDVFDRLLFIGLWSYVDDNGVGRDDAVAIAADLFADDLSRKPQETLTHIAGGLQAIEGRGCIVRWKVDDPESKYDGKHLFKIVHWARHQSIKRPSQGHKYPNPPANVVRHSPTLQETPGHGTGEQGNRGTGDSDYVGARAPAPTAETPAAETDNTPALIPDTTPPTPQRQEATAQTLVAEWIDHCKVRPPGNIVGQTSKQLRMLLDDGLTADQIRPGLIAWQRKGAHPSALPSFVNQELNSSPDSSRTRTNGLSDDQWAAAMRRAITYDQQETR